jgi:large subunit ribosomal protein L4
MVIEDFNFETPKTSSYASVLSALKLNGRKTLMVLPENIQNIVLSSRNIQRAKVTRACDLNTFDILNAQNLILLVSSVNEIEKSFEN